jgi:hypothetical protein
MAGSTQYTLCGVGTYNPHTGASSVANCIACPQGYACEVEGMTGFGDADEATAADDNSTIVTDTGYSDTDYNSSGQCPGGYYCSEGTSDGVAVPCTYGYACPTGVPNRIVCLAGFYQDAL